MDTKLLLRRCGVALLGAALAISVYDNLRLRALVPEVRAVKPVAARTPSMPPVPRAPAPTEWRVPLAEQERRTSPAPAPVAKWTGLRVLGETKEDLGNPVYQQIRSVMHRRVVLRDFGPLVAELGLDANTSAKLIDLLVTRHTNIAEAQNVLGGQAQLTTEQRADVLAEAAASENASINSLVGEEVASTVLAALSVDRELKAIRETVRMDMSYAGLALTARQEVALASAMKAAGYMPTPAMHNRIAEAYGQEMTRTPGSSFDAVLQTTSGTLTAGQLEVLRRSNAQKVAQEQILDQRVAAAQQRLGP